MINYNQKPKKVFNQGERSIASFISKEKDTNVDWTTIKSFSKEWLKFQHFSSHDIESIGDEYFDIIDKELLTDAIVLDIGCGSGRWSKYLSDRVKFIEAVDPSESVFVASDMLAQTNNVRITKASIGNLPFNEESFDLVISLGVLHHIPDTEKALIKCVDLCKSGGTCLLYIYYNFDNRPKFFKIIFYLIDLFRKLICNLPVRIKIFFCDVIAYLVYWPISRLSRILMGNLKIFSHFPLSYYHDKSMYILRNDALDRFGTSLEQRFSKERINQMMMNAGLKNIIFSEKAPYWHASGTKE